MGLPATARESGATAVVIDAEWTEVRPRLRELLRVVWAYRYLCACAVGAGLVAGILVALLLPRRYTAATRLLVARQSPIQLRLEENVLRLDEDRSSAAESSFLATQITALQSRDLAERVIRTLGLAGDESFVAGRADPAHALAGRVASAHRPRGWGGPLAPAHDDATGGSPAPPKLIDRYMRYLSVRDVRGADVVEVRFTTPSAALSALLAAAHVQAYLEANEDARRATNATAEDFLGRQLADSRANLERVQAALSGFAAGHPSVAANQEQQVLVQRIAELSTLITKAEGHRIALESRYEFLARPGSDALAYFLDRPGVQKLHLRLRELEAARAALVGRLGPNHPRMLALAREENAVRGQLGHELEEETAAIRGKHATAVGREEQLRRKLAEQEQAALEMRDLGARYDRLKADLHTAQGLHDSLLKQQLETAVHSQLAASNVRVVERAEVPRVPSTPNVPLLVTLGILAGLAAGVGAALVCEWVDDSFKSARDLETRLRLPLLATIVNFDVARRMRATGTLPAPVAGPPEARRAELVVVSEPSSLVAEAFRTLRGAVVYDGGRPAPKVIVVTSAVAGEGKTVTSLNLAAALAEAGARVVLVDADLRRPGCQRALGVGEDVPGLGGVLAGTLELEQGVRTLDEPRIAFLAAGPAVPNPAALIGGPSLRDALLMLAAAYDFVVVDSPPVLPVTDALVLAREADAVVLVVKGHDTPREMVRRARDQLRQADARVLGLTVNDVDLGWSDLYAYGRYYASLREVA